MIDVFNLCDFIRVQVQNVKLVQVLQVSYSLYIVFTEHENPKGGDRMQMCDFLYLIIVQVKEDQIWEGDQVLNFSDMVVLQVEQTEALLSFQKGHVR